MDERLLLTLYIAGQTARSEQAVSNLQHLCEEHLRPGYELVIVDVFEQPELAEQAKIIATPALIRSCPRPLRCIVGDLSDATTVLSGLGLTSVRSS